MKRYTWKMLHVVQMVVYASLAVMSMVTADCDRPPNILNAYHNITNSPPYPEGTSAWFDCEPGFNPAGPSRYYICNDTVWIQGNFQCEEIFCTYVSPPQNGLITNEQTNKVGTSLGFSCNEGHDMSGPNSMLCRTDGDWSPTAPPVCTAKDCGELGSIQYADTFQDTSETERNHYGSIVEVTCENGRVLNGRPHVKCEADGQWGDRPTCEILQCPPYPNTNSSCVEGTLLSGNFYFMTCKDDISTKAGPDAAECIAGKWDTLGMKCLCDCIISDYNTSLISISNLGSFGNMKHAETLYFDCVGESFSSGSWLVMCFNGLLNALQDGNTVEIANYSIQSDINNEIVSMLCTLPASVSSTTSTVLQASETSTATMLLPTQFVLTSSRLNLSSTVVSSEVISPTTTSLQMTFSSSSEDMNSFSVFSIETNNYSYIKTKNIIPTNTYSTNSISLSASASSTASGINSPTSMFTENFISTPTTVLTMTTQQTTASRPSTSLTKSISLSTSESSTASELKPSTSKFSVTATNTSTKTLISIPTTVLTITTQLNTASKPSTSFRMDSLSSFSSVSTSILAPIQHDITPTMVSSMTTTSIQTLASSVSSEDISQVDFSTPTNLVTKRNDVFQTASQPITTTDIPSSASLAYSRNRSRNLITVSSTPSRTITAPSLTKSISLSTSESSTASELKPSTSMFTVTAINTSTKTLISTPTTVFAMTTQLTTASKPSTSFRMDSLSSFTSVSTSILAPKPHGITPTKVSSMKTTTSVQTLALSLSSKDISQVDFLTSTNLVTKSNDMFQTASLPMTTKGTDILNTALLPVTTTDVPSVTNLVTKLSYMTPTFVTSTVSPLSSRMKSTFESSSSSIAYDVTNRIVTVLPTTSTENTETTTKRSGTSHLDCNLFLVFFIFFVDYSLNE